MPYYQGRVHSIIYSEPVKAFYILKVLLDDESAESFPPSSRERRGLPLIVRGHVPGLTIAQGTWFGFEAEWQNHSKHGLQLAILKAPVLEAGWSADSAGRALAANGVSARIVEHLRESLPEDAFLAALEDSTLLELVPGIDNLSARIVAQKWAMLRATFEGAEFLSALGLPQGKLKQVWATFGDAAITVLSKNPWALVQIDGISFRQADEVSRKLRLSQDSPLRLEGAVLHACKAARQHGHLYLVTGQIETMVRQEGVVASSEAFAKALVSLRGQGHLVLDKTTRPGTLAIYEPWNFEIERVSAELLRARLQSPPDPEWAKALAVYGQRAGQEASLNPEHDSLVEIAETVVAGWSSTSRKITLSPAQKQGVCNALVHPVSVLTGLPGTGKTQTCRAIVQILQGAGLQALLCAPTGIAAKRLGNLTGHQAVTVHRGFGAQGTGGEETRTATYKGVSGSTLKQIASNQGELWEHGPGNPHPADVVLLDESSMADQHLLYRVLTCTKETCRYVFVGDHAQLPSVGPGNVLKDMISSGQVPVVRLSEIFRQADTSGIVFAAHAIHKGVVPDLSSPDFTLLPVGSESAVADEICRLAVQWHSEGVDFQVLSPRHAGVVGVTALNSQLRDLLNPASSSKQESRVGMEVVREGDRIMIVQNDYELAVFNGDLGRVVRINRKLREIEVELLATSPVVQKNIPSDKADRLLRLAYACTIHKSQGIEYDRVLIPVVSGFQHQLVRNLYYTAITRARHKVVLVGEVSALGKAVANAKEDERNTLFRERLVAG